jgi:hypothetical protein
MDRVTIREREEIENEEERLEKDKQRQADLRKKESRRVCRTIFTTHVNSLSLPFPFL